MKKIIHTEKAPKAIGPYSQGVLAENTLYISGQIPLDPATGKLVEGDISAQTHRALKNLCEILREAEFSPSDVVKTTCYLSDMDNFAPMNEEYAKVFGVDSPARAAFQVVKLPLGAMVEIEAVAVRCK